MFHEFKMRMDIFCNYDWPGNVRELQNVLKRYMTLKDVDLMNASLLFKGEKVHSHLEFMKHMDISLEGNNGEISDLRSAVKKYEKTLILKALNQAYWNRKKASEILGIPLRTLSRKIKNFRLI